MELKQLFQPAKVNAITYIGMSENDQLYGAVTSLHGTELISGDYTVAILGIDEAVNSPGNQGCAASPDFIRSYLWGLKRHHAKLKILDLGNVLGSSVKDKYWAIKETVAALSDAEIPLLVIGGSQDYSIPIVGGLANDDNPVNLCVIDALMDHAGDADDLTSVNFIGNLLKNNQAAVAQLSFIGLQKYLMGQVASDILEKDFVDHLRLGELRAEAIRESEPLLREAHFVCFDAICMRHAEMPGQLLAMPNGFSAAEACQMAWYSGASDANKAFGLFEINAQKDPSHVSVALGAQMAWFYIEGIMARSGDYPKREITTYATHNVDKEELGLDLRFFHNPISSRWWVEMDVNGKKIIRPCSERDYHAAVRNELPDKFWKRFV
jgi:formiminoglutamase